MTARPKVAVVGVGVMGSYHARVVAQSERAELALIVDPDEAAGRAVAQRYDCRWQPELDSTADLAAVVVATPTEWHSGVVLDVLGAGTPVLVEKPVTANLAETVRILDTAQAADLPIMCGFVERFNPAVLTLRELVTDEPAHVTATRHSPYAGRIRTGVAWDLLIHDIDTCLRLFDGPTVDVQAGLGYFHPLSGETGGEDVADAVLTFASGAIATVSASRIGHRKVRSISVTELNRAIEVDLLRRDVTIYRHVSHDSPTHDGLGYRQQTIIEIPELVSAREPLAAQFDHFLGLLAGTVDRHRERESILGSHQVIDRVMASANVAAPLAPDGEEIIPLARDGEPTVALAREAGARASVTN
jgi:predicted dehydrogenase